MQKLDLYGVNYVSDQLNAVKVEMTENFLKKLCEAPIPELNYEERYRLRNLLLQASTYITMLQRDIEDLNAQQKKSRKIRLFRK